MFANPVRLARYLLIILAAVLDVFAIGSLMRIEPTANNSLAYAIYAFLMFLEAAVILVCAFWIAKHKRFYWLAVFLLALNIGLTIFDQFGIADLLFVLLNMFTLLVLLSFLKELTLKTS